MHHCVQFTDDILHSETFEYLQFLYVCVRGAKVLIEHPVDDARDVRAQGVPHAGVHRVLGHPLVRHVRGLQHVEHLAHVAP